MGLILDSSVLIGAERQSQSVSGLLRDIKATTGESSAAMSAVSVIELAHGIWRADTWERAQRRSTYLKEIYAAIQVVSFTREMGERAARIDAEIRKAVVGSGLLPCRRASARREPCVSPVFSGERFRSSFSAARQFDIS